MVVAIAWAMGGAFAQPAAPEPQPVASVASLKAAYLHCDHVMSSQRVDTALAQRCAAVGEELKQRAFGGDFARLIAWWNSERAATMDANSAAVHGS
jgi:hypothetical protein